MIKNYFLSAFRSLQRNKSSVVINLLGLILGFTCFLIINLYVYREFRYDTYNENADRIYRVTHNEKAGEVPGTRHLPTVGPPVGPALKETFPQVAEAVRFRYSPNRIVRYQDKQYYESRMFYADPSVFRMFTLPLVAGDASTALKLPNHVVLTEAMARKYFGNDEALGKIITLDNNTELKVTGVLADLPQNTHLKFDFLLPFEAFKVPFGYPVTLNDWGWISFHTYVMLKPGEDAAALQDQLKGFVKTHWPEERAKRFRMELQPLTDIYLGNLKHEQVASGNKTYLYVLSGAAFLILFIAAFNFTNLFSAVSTSRAKEMGVRKVIGARNYSLAIQLMGQAILIALTAAIGSLLLLPLMSPLLMTWGFPLEIGFQEYQLAALVILLAAFLIGVVSGLQPSISFSSLDHQRLLKGVFKTGLAGLFVRRSLVLAQFTISISLLAAVLIINDQMDFLKTKDLGYAKNELLLLRMPGDQLVHKFPLLRNQLTQNPNVSVVSVGGGRMDGDNGNVPIYTETTGDVGQPMNIDAVTFDFFKTIGVTLVAGREFTFDQPADTLRGVIINQSAAREFGWTDEQAIGKKIRIGDIVLDGEIIGVTPDFHFGSLHTSIQPLIMSYPRTHLQDVFVRFSTDNLSELISSVQKDWREVAPELPFDFVLLNDHLQGMYRSEQFFLILFRLFGTVAIVIACLGLYGLISQDVVYRIKEIGIRKVLGASVQGITFLLLKQFLLLVVLANLIAWPFCWYFMNEWLSEFSYHINISWMVFPIAGLAALVIAILTVSYKSIQSARMNPVKSLRSE